MLRPVRKSRVEEQNQVAFVAWFRTQYPQYANLLTLGSFGENIGERRMARLKQMGLTPGFPDLYLAFPTEHYHGLYIEMKKKNGKVTAIQKKIHELLKEQGYAVHVAYYWLEAKDVLNDYLELCY